MVMLSITARNQKKKNSKTLGISPQTDIQPLMKSFFKNIALMTSGTAGLLIIASLSCVILYKYIDPPVTLLMIIRYFETHSKEKTLEKEWKNIEEISPYALLAVLASEDQKFFDHYGFDIKEITKAIEKKKKTNKL